ncbi:hypothetical protein [Dyella acidisoli]|uniref:Secreted protein n=1 Tax=Dyella acidisoli TaxID=1867834 RepID=A0ABQ5XMU9_9GAMM|nr:hypothetical protein [Dyella acidisoli]GLQ93035.1 hypothetical protein GCM10007901_19860 [Dyella acidisoli]
MRSSIFIAATLLALTINAQGTLQFRANDPFAFCTQGQDLPDPCWKPLPPYTGGAAWTYTGTCDPPNEYGRLWTGDDYRALSQYQAICAMAGKSGAWTGETPPDLVPFKH